MGKRKSADCQISPGKITFLTPESCSEHPCPFYIGSPWGKTLTRRAVLIAVGSCIITGYFSMDIVLFILPAGLPI